VKYRSCGICNNTDVEILHNLKFKLLENIKLPDNYDIVICNKCGLVYADTFATQKDYDEFYKNNNIYENSASYSDIEKYKMTFDELRIHWKRDESILDIGFANGELLKLFNKNGYIDLYGLDPSENCVKSLEQYGLVSYQGSILNHSINRKFDNIILSHVMEHILDIPKAINSIYNLLNDGGNLYIETPDIMQYLENSASPFNFMDIEHINHFSRNSLILLAIKNNFEVITSGTKKWSIGNNKFYPASFVLCKKTTYSVFEIKEYVKKYLSTCLEKQYPEIDYLIKSQKEIIVWGTGSLTQRLYTMANLNKCNIKMYVDNSKIKIGTLFDNKIIYAPSEIKSNESILILSVYDTNNIIKQIKEMGLRNEIITLNIL